MTEVAVADTTLAPSEPHPSIARIDRDQAVRKYGQPTRTWGSVNEPRHREADGIKFNESWSFKSPRDLDSDWTERTLYWFRYDLVASVRVHRDGKRVREEIVG